MRTQWLTDTLAQCLHEAACVTELTITVLLFFQCFVLAGSVCVQILRFSKQGWLGLRSLFEQFGNDKDPMIAFDHGSHKAELDVRKGLIALGVTTQSILTDVLMAWLYQKFKIICRHTPQLTT